MTEGYTTPDGAWYRTPQEEIESRVGCKENAEGTLEAYRFVWKIMGKPSLIYLDIRAAGQAVGIGPEIAGNEIAGVVVSSLDKLAVAGTVFGGGLMKICEGLISFDVRSSRRNLKEAEARLGLSADQIDLSI